TARGQARYHCSTRINYGRDACSTSSISEAFVRERLMAYVRKDLLNPDGLADLRERRRLERERLHKDQPARVEALRRQAADLTQKIDGLTAKLSVIAAADPEGLAHYTDSIRQWREQRQAVEAKIAETLAPPKLVELDAAVKHVEEYSFLLGEV